SLRWRLRSRHKMGTANFHFRRENPSTGWTVREPAMIAAIIVHLITTVLRVVRPGGVRPSSNPFSPNITLQSVDRHIAIQQLANLVPHRPAADVQSADDYQWTYCRDHGQVNLSSGPLFQSTTTRFQALRFII